MDQNMSTLPWNITPILSSSQVMPQLLNYLKADRLGRSVDWGVLAVFTCADSCSLGMGYTEEFVWKQDVTDTPWKRLHSFFPGFSR